MKQVNLKTIEQSKILNHEDVIDCLNEISKNFELTDKYTTITSDNASVMKVTRLITKIILNTYIRKPAKLLKQIILDVLIIPFNYVSMKH